MKRAMIAITFALLAAVLAAGCTSTTSPSPSATPSVTPSAMISSPTASPSTASPSAQSARSSVAASAIDIDTNHDGVIDARDVRAIDTNHDGIIDKEDVLNLMNATNALFDATLKPLYEKVGLTIEQGHVIGQGDINRLSSAEQAQLKAANNEWNVRTAQVNATMNAALGTKLPTSVP